MVAPALAAMYIFFKWMMLKGVSLGSRISGRFSFRLTSAALWIRLSATPDAMAASVFIEQGAMTMPSFLNDPLAGGAKKSSCS